MSGQSGEEVRDKRLKCRIHGCPRFARETVSNLGVVWVRLAAADRESGMKWRVMVELIGSDGTVHAHEVNAGGSTLSLSLDRETRRPGLPPFGVFLVHATDPRMMRLCLLVRATLAPRSCDRQAAEERPARRPTPRFFA